MLVLFLLGTVALRWRADWEYTLKVLLTVFGPEEWGPQETQPVGFWSMKSAGRAADLQSLVLWSGLSVLMFKGWC